jgi:hypothetical protein
MRFLSWFSESSRVTRPLWRSFGYSPQDLEVIYFIHDPTSHTIKIGWARNPARRLSTLQISTSNKLVLLGAIGGTKRTEKKVHALVYRHCAPKADEPYTRPLCVQGEWFDDRILPFVTELMKPPKAFLEADKKPSDRPRPARRDLSVHQGKIVLVFDSGETFHEFFILKAALPELALTALVNIADARLSFLAHTVRITQLAVPGCPTRKVNLQGAFVTQNCIPREGLSVIFNSEPGKGYSILHGIKQYSNRWLHGVPSELYNDDNPWYTRPTNQFYALLNQFAQALSRNQCVIIAQTPLVVRGLIPRGIGLLPKGELRSKANKKAASKRKRQRSAEEAPRPKDGIVYFIQDAVTLAIKIGFCLKKPKKRLAALQTGNSNTLRLLGQVPGSVLHEKLLHVRFSRFRIQGEWFSNAIIADIEGILKYSSLEEWVKAQDSDLPQQSVPGGEAGPSNPS